MTCSSIRTATSGTRDFGELFISKFDPKTLKLTEYPVKKFKPDAPVGQLSLEQDHQGKFWFDTMYQGSLGSLDPKTGEIKYYPLAAEWNDDRVQLNFVGLRHDVDGKVWTKSVGTQDIFRLDLATNKWEKFHPTDKLPGGPYGIYQVISNSKNNLWMAEFTEGHIGKIDAKTLEVTWFATADGARTRAAAADRRPGPHPVRRISRQQGRAVRHQDGEVHRVSAADPLQRSVPGADRQERRHLDRRHADRPRHPARSQDRPDRRISDADRHQHARRCSSTTRRRR